MSYYQLGQLGNSQEYLSEQGSPNQTCVSNYDCLRRCDVNKKEYMIPEECYNNCHGHCKASINKNMSCVTNLNSLFSKYGSDKAKKGGYTQVYCDAFRGRPITSLLEVGIGTLTNGPSNMRAHGGENYTPGGSLRAFRDHLPMARVVGMDIAPDTVIREARIKTVMCDSRKACGALGSEKFDVILDDGLHTEKAQLATAKQLIPHLADEGVYIIEDVYPGKGTDIKERLQKDFSLRCSVAKDFSNTKEEMVTCRR